MNGPMAWWYWFGMWIGGIAGLLVTWWLFLDAVRRKGSPTRCVWPAVSACGLLMQLPSFAMDPQQPIAATIGVVGVIGVVVIGVAAVTYFSGAAPGGGSVWSASTRDSAAGSAPHERRVRSARAAVPLPEPPQERMKPAPRASSVTPASAAPVVASSAKPAVETGAAPAIRSESPPPVTVSPVPGPAADPDPTIAEEPDATIAVDAEATIAEEPSAPVLGDTVVDEPGDTLAGEPTSTLVEDGSPDAQLIITDGRVSRIVITERSGPFVVGRDPSKCSLAVDDHRVSRRHFNIDRLNTDYIMTDLESANGTFLNGRPVIGPEVLRDGDVIEFGRTTATFTTGAGAK